MPKTITPPAVRYAENLKKLLELHKTTVAAIAETAKVRPKQVYNFMKVSHDPRIKGLEKVARAFGLSAWQMLAVDLTTKPAENKYVLTLLELVASTDESGRAAIMQVAEMAASRSPKQS